MNEVNRQHKILHDQHRFSQGRAEEAIASQDSPKKIFLEKNVPNFFIFQPRTLLGRRTEAIQISEVRSPPLPQEECPP